MLLDLNMPVMDGYEAIHHLRHNLSLTGLPIIVLTAVDGQTVERRESHSSPIRDKQFCANIRQTLLTLAHNGNIFPRIFLIGRILTRLLPTLSQGSAPAWFRLFVST